MDIIPRFAVVPIMREYVVFARFFDCFAPSAPVVKRVLNAASLTRYVHIRRNDGGDENIIVQVSDSFTDISKIMVASACADAHMIAKLSFTATGLTFLIQVQLWAVMLPCGHRTSLSVAVVSFTRAFA